MQVNPYLNFDGRCAAAFKFYEQVLGGTIVFMQTHGDSPAREHTTPDWYDKVMHASLKVGNVTLMGSDLAPAHYVQPKGISVSLNIPNLAEAERIFNALAEGGSVTLPFQKTFWTPGFGMTVDRFGIPWMVNCEQPVTT
jgi:PhnB protein